MFPKNIYIYISHPPLKKNKKKKKRKEKKRGNL